MQNIANTVMEPGSPSRKGGEDVTIAQTTASDIVNNKSRKRITGYYSSASKY